ncbi:hypothetical protein F5Y19DRAFT_393643 [Xylariaceae sp. FL1651]|nr:hypothetical protein F5Y19DRAFT_393643 [Xylariaceae sp. FL1651]
MPLAIASMTATGAYTNSVRIVAFVQPQLSIAAFIVFTWQVSRYELQSRCSSAMTMTFTMGLLVAGIQAICIKMMDNRGLTESEKAHLYGLLAAAILCVWIGYWSLYSECLSHQGRVISVDLLALVSGVIASAFSLILNCIYAGDLRLNLAIVVHSSALALESGLLASHMIWRFRTRRVRDLLKGLDITLEELASLYLEIGQPFKYAASCKYFSQEDAPLPRLEVSMILVGGNPPLLEYIS